MEDLVKLLPFFERAGSVAAVLLSGAVYYLVREVGKRDASIKVLGERLEGFQVRELERVSTLTAVVEKNTAAAGEQARLIGILLDRAIRTPGSH